MKSRDSRRSCVAFLVERYAPRRSGCPRTPPTGARRSRTRSTAYPSQTSFSKSRRCRVGPRRPRPPARVGGPSWPRPPLARLSRERLGGEAAVRGPPGDWACGGGLGGAPRREAARGAGAVSRPDDSPRAAARVSSRADPASVARRLRARASVVQIRVTLKTRNPFAISALSISGVTWKCHFLNHAPPRATAVPSETAESTPTQRDRHLRCIAEHGRMGWQKRSGYNARARAEMV